MEYKLPNIIIVLTVCCSALLLNGNYAQTTNEIKVGDVYPGDISIGGFELSSNGTIEITGRSISYKSFEENLVYYAWMLNSKTREVVWHLEDADDFDEDGGIYEFEDEIDLKAGVYEVYFAGNIFDYDDIKNFSDFWDRVFTKKKKSFKRRDRSKLGMTVKAEANIFTEIDGEDAITEFTKGSIISINRVGDSEELSKGFSLSDETEIRIYALGEGRDRTMHDYAWIYDLNQNKIVWKINERRTDHAGGGKKNRLVDREITLPEGSYKLFYVTDDTHSYDEWNVLPPDDPQMWGVTIWPASDDDADNVIPFVNVEGAEPIVAMNRIGDNEYKSQGFTLENDTEIRVLALGEGYDRHELADYGWIIDAETKEIVWEMQNNRYLEHAGGAKKNRMVDQVIKLDKGSYVVYYTSDGSHSYEDWNADPPFERSRWGITLWAVDKSDRNNIKLFDEDDYENENVIAEIVRVRDNKRLSKTFTLDEDTKVRIIAIGEGSRSGMADYGWIENERGRVIWEMTYRKTDYAGGAKKNRLFNDTILLEEGTYEVYYETDDSHAYRDWNSTPPHNEQAYGITILYEN